MSNFIITKIKKYKKVKKGAKRYCKIRKNIIEY